MKLILILSIIFCFFGCTPRYNENRENLKRKYDIIVIDECEYIYISIYREGYLAHKGNCKYCEKRRKEEKNIIKKWEK